MMCQLTAASVTDSLSAQIRSHSANPPGRQREWPKSRLKQTIPQCLRQQSTTEEERKRSGRPLIRWARKDVSAS